MRFVDRGALEAHQLGRLQALFETVLAGNAFYQAKLREAPASLEEFTSSVPFSWKHEFVEDQARHPPYGTNLSHPLGSYVRLHQTSGTTSAPLRWLDTAESWSWMLDNWDRIFDATELTVHDRVFFPFGFGPFIGFWLAFEAASRRGSLVIPGGGIRTDARLRLIMDHEATVVCATPTYAIRMGETAAEIGVDLSQSKVRALIVAGEPGGAVPATRALIEKLWGGARIVDHHGMTEVGPASYECPKRTGVLHVMEEAFVAEVIDPETAAPVEPGDLGELVLTTLGRFGSPAIRYRTRDIVRRGAPERCECGSLNLALEGGIVGRVDDMVVVRGVNVYPSAIEDLLRREGGVAEFRAEIRTERGLSEVKLLIEPAAGHDGAELAGRVAAAVQQALGLRFAVECVGCGDLPRFEAKAKRWVRI